MTDTLLDLCKHDFEYDASIFNKVYAYEWLDKNFTDIRRIYESNRPIVPLVDYVRFAYKTHMYNMEKFGQSGWKK